MARLSSGPTPPPTWMNPLAGNAPQCTGSPTAPGLIALRDAVSGFLDGTQLGEAVRAQVTEELSANDDLDWSPEDRVAFGKLTEEVALLTVDPGADDAGMPGDAESMPAEDDSSGTPLRAFAADPSAPAALAARALAWYEHIRYGLWRIAEPVPAPGLWCTDIVSGTERYVEFPAEATVGLPRWTVWLGRRRPGRRDLAQHGGGSQAQSGRGRCSRGVDQCGRTGDGSGDRRET